MIRFLPAGKGVKAEIQKPNIGQTKRSSMRTSETHLLFRLRVSLFSLVPQKEAVPWFPAVHWYPEGISWWCDIIFTVPRYLRNESVYLLYSFGSYWFCPYSKLPRLYASNREQLRSTTLALTVPTRARRVRSRAWVINLPAVKDEGDLYNIMSSPHLSHSAKRFTCNIVLSAKLGLGGK